MSTTVWPYVAPQEQERRTADALAREAAWLLEQLQETLASLKTGLEECYTLLAPVEPGSTLVVSSVRSESVKGHLTRVGTTIVKGNLVLRLKTHPPLSLSVSTQASFELPALTSLRRLLNEALDCVDITRWTGDKTSAPFISSQLRLLHSILTEARGTLKGSPPKDASVVAESPGDDSEVLVPIPSNTFSPPLPAQLAMTLTIQEAALILTIRATEPADAPMGLGSRFAFAIGAQRRLEHDEMDKVWLVDGTAMRVREKVRVESADPSLMAVQAKLAALEHSLGMARCCLAIVMDEDINDL